MKVASLVGNSVWKWLVLSGFAILLIGDQCDAWTVPRTSSRDKGACRRNFLETVVASTLTTIVATSPANADDDENNEFIARLKANSEAKKDLYKKQAQTNDKLSARFFASQYQRPSYLAVRRADSSIEMVLAQDVEIMLQKGTVVQVWVDEDDYGKGQTYEYKH